LLTRNGNDWSDRFPSVRKALERLDVKSCLIDGELVVCDEHGLAVFELLRSGYRIKSEAHLIAFDPHMASEVLEVNRWPRSDRTATSVPRDPAS
jgi:ATP-dependent DNA ligase